MKATFLLTAAAISMAFSPALANGDQWQHLDLVGMGLPSNAITSLDVGSSGIWAGTDSGLLHFDGNQWTVFDTASSDIPANQITDVHLDSDGGVWVATYEGLGVYRDNEWTTFTVANSMLPTDLTRSLTSDQQGNIWIGTWGGGLVKFSKFGWEVFHTANSGIPANGIYSVEIDASNRIWVGTHSGGAAVLENGLWTVFNTGNSSLPHDNVLSVGFGEGSEVWLGTQEGLARVSFDGDVDWQVYTSLYFGYAVHAFKDVVTDEQGMSWFATDGGMLRFDGTTSAFYFTSNSGIAHNNCAAIAADMRGNVFVGHAQSGISVYNPDGVQLPVDELTEVPDFISVSPNPTHDVLRVKFPQKGGADVRLVVTDLSGRIVIEDAYRSGSNDIAQQVIDVSSLPSGVYMVLVKGIDSVVSAPFVKG